MGYIGRGPVKSGAFRIIDDVSSGFDGSDVTFTLQHNSSNITPGTEQNLLIAVDGVVQEPQSAFTISGSTLTFTSAPASGASFWGVELGDVGGIAQTIANGTVDTSQLVADSVDGTIDALQVTGAKIANDTITEGKLDVSNGPTNDYFLQAQSGEGGGLTWAAAATAFIGCRAYTTAVQSIPHNAQTNVNFAGEDFKAGVTHSTSSDPDEFTIVTAGYYQMNFFGRLGGAGDFILVAAWIARQPDGSGITNIASDQAGGPSDNAINDPSFHVSCIYNLSVDDVIRFRINHYNSGNTARNTVVGTGYSTIAEIWKIG